MTKFGEVFLGIDGGGTGCRALLVDHAGKALGSGNSGAANIMTNFEQAGANILIACQAALEEAGLAHAELATIPVFMGLAGANIGDFANRFMQDLPFKFCRIETDAIISLEGAIGPADGVAAIIGTGSVFISRNGDTVRTVGGWGFTVGDLASGAWLGRRLLQEALLSYDGIHQGSPLTKNVLDRFENNPQTVVEYAHTARPGEFGELAPLVFKFFDKRDPIARRILRRAVSDIEDTFDHILSDEVPRFCMIGGLGPVYAQMLSSYYRVRVSEPLGDAVTGAASLARKHFCSGGA